MIAERLARGGDLLVHASRSGYELAGQPCGGVGGEKHGDRRKIGWQSHAPERRRSNQLLLPLGTHHAECARTLGIDKTGKNGVDANLTARELNGEYAGDAVQGALCGGIDCGSCFEAATG